MEIVKWIVGVDTCVADSLQIDIYIYCVKLC